MLAALALLSGAPSAAAMPFSAEQRLGEPAWNERVLWQRYSQAVFDGENYVVLWENERSRFGPFSGGFRFATRVTEDGTVLDERGLLVARSSPSSLVMTAAPWGTLLVYPDAGNVVGLRLGRDRELDLEPRVLVEGGGDYPTSAAACLDSGCLLLYSSGSGMDVRTLGVALDGCGERVPGTDLELPSGAWTLRAAADGYVAFGRVPATGAMTALQAIGLSADGLRRFGPVTISAPRETSIAFGAGPSGSLVVFNDPSGQKLEAVCLDSNGTIDGEHPVLESAERVSVGGMSAEGDHYRLGVQIGANVATFAVDACGQRLEEPVSIASDDGTCTLNAPRLASGTRSAWLSWDWGINSPDCEIPPATGAVVTADPTALVASVEIQNAAARMGPPALGSDGTSYLAAWYEDRARAPGLYTQALSADGEPLEQAVLTIPSDSHPTPARTASVSFVGGRYVVELHATETTSYSESWSEPNAAADVEPRTLSRGRPRTQQPLGTPGGNAFLQTSLIVHQQGEDLPTLRHLSVVATDASTTPLSEEWTRPYSQGAGDSDPVVAFDGSSFGVVWKHQEPVSGVDYYLEVLFMKFDEAGQPLLAEPVVIPALDDYEPASLTFGDGVYLLTLLTPERAEVLVRLTPEGELLDAEPRPLIEATGGSVYRQPRGAIFDGAAFVLAWSERGVGSPEMPTTRHLDDDLRVAVVSADGTVLADGWVTSCPENEFSSAGLASLGRGQSLLGYNRFDDDPDTLALRGFVRVLGDGECQSETVCSDDACDEPCCVRGCRRSSPEPSCEIADCEPACSEGTHCVARLGCVADGARRPPRIVRTEGCGCTIPGRGRSGPEALAVLLVVLVARTARGFVRRGSRRRKVASPETRASRRASGSRLRMRAARLRLARKPSAQPPASGRPERLKAP